MKVDKMIKNLLKNLMVFMLIVLVVAVGTVPGIETDVEKISAIESQNMGTIEITFPKMGCLCVLDQCIPMSILDGFGWCVVVDNQLRVETNTSGSIDYVVFHVENRIGEEDNQTDVTYPFNCSFRSDLSIGLIYRITATAYYNGSVCGEDKMIPIAYIPIDM